MKHWRSIIERYTIEQVTAYTLAEDAEMQEYICTVSKRVSYKYGKLFGWENFKPYTYAHAHRLMLCRRDGRPVGVMLSRVYGSVFDPDVKILFQDLLYGEPGTRAAYLLLRDFIDFGKANANHIITAIGKQTNIKRRSLERLGFNKLEEAYQIEVNRERTR